MPRGAQLSLVATLSIVLFPMASRADAAEDAAAILRSATDRIKSAEEFATDFEFAVKVGLPGLEHGRFARYKIVIERPNRFAFLRTDGDMGATVVSNGQTLTQYVSELGQYTQTEAPASLDAFSSSVTGMMLIEGGMGGFMMALLADDPFARLTSNVTQYQYVGEEVIDGLACHHLRLVQEEWDIDLWITTGDAPVLRRIRPDLSKQLGEEEQELGFSIAISLEYENWNFAPEIADGSFAFTPPASAELVDQLSPRVPDAVMPPIVAVHPLVGQPAPKFTLAQLDGGESQELESVLGKKVVVLDFWATWCPPCVEGLPQLAKVTEQFKDKDVAVFAVNIEEEPDTIREFLEQRELDLPVLLDAQGEAAKKYEVSGIPQTVLVGLDGRVQVVHTGMVDNLEAELTKAIEALLAGEDLATAELEKSEQAGKSQDEPATR